MFVCILRHFKRYSERGNVLLSTILIMGLSLNIGLVIAILALGGLGRTSSLKSKALSYYAAESGAEYSLFKVRKGGVEIEKLAISATSEPDINLTTQGKISTQNIIEDLEENKSIIIFLYDPASWTSGINKLVVSWSDTCNGSSILETKYYSINQQTDLNNLNWNSAYQREDLQADEGTFDIYLSPDYAYVFKITAKNCYVNFLNIKAQTDSNNDGIYEDKDINVENVITATASAGDVKQTIRVSM